MVSFNYYLKILDRLVGFYLFLLVILLNPINKYISKNKNYEKKILVIKLWALGDSILLLPTLKLLKRNYPLTEISILVTQQNAEIFKSSEYIDDVIILNTEPFTKLFKNIVLTLIYIIKNNYLVTIDAEPFTFFSAVLTRLSLSKITIGFGNQKIRSFAYDKKIFYKNNEHAIHRYLSLLSPFKINYSNINLEKISVGLNDYNNINFFIESDINIKKFPIIGVYSGPFDNVTERQWPIDRFVVLCDTLLKKGYQVILIGNKNEEEYIFKSLINKMKYKPIMLAGKTTIKQLAIMMEIIDVFISSDSGPIHFASAMGTPTIALFGPGSPDTYKPLSKNSIVLYKKLNCGPCINGFKGYSKKCSEKICIKSISLTEVLISLEYILEKISDTKLEERERDLG